MSVLLTTYGSRGDVEPLVGLAMVTGGMMPVGAWL